MSISPFPLRSWGVRCSGNECVGEINETTLVMNESHMKQTPFSNPPCRPWLGMALGLAVLATACDKGAGMRPASVTTGTIKCPL